MTTKMVTIQETFNLFNDSQIAYDLVEPAEIPYLQVLFLVARPFYLIDDTIHVPVLDPKVHNLFRDFRKQFAAEHAADLRNGVSLTNFSPMDKLRKIVTELTEDLEDHFVIPGELEIDSIDIRGNWLTFNSPLDSPMRRKMMN